MPVFIIIQTYTSNTFFWEGVVPPIFVDRYTGFGKTFSLLAQTSFFSILTFSVPNYTALYLLVTLVTKAILLSCLITKSLE
jgi:hypothetical protein